VGIGPMVIPLFSGAGADLQGDGIVVAELADPGIGHCSYRCLAVDRHHSRCIPVVMGVAEVSLAKVKVALSSAALVKVKATIAGNLFERRPAVVISWGRGGKYLFRKIVNTLLL
jgi:hypothetical protein